MDTKFVLKELISPEEMYTTHCCILEMYPKMSLEQYSEMINAMHKNSYFQLAVLFEDEIVAVSGIWINTKLWCGKYMELDNVIVKEKYRSSGIGKIIAQYLNQKAKDLDCKLMALDSYTDNKRSHKFYMNDGYDITGFHFTKKI